jgi:hypothetical protein
MPDPRDVPEFHARVRDAVRADPDGAAEAIRAQLRMLQAYAQDMPILEQMECASAQDMAQAHWLEQALSAEAEKQAQTSAAPTAEEEAEME